MAVASGPREQVTPSTGDPLAALARIPEIQRSLDRARTAVDAVLWDRTVIGSSATFAARSRVLGAHANAAFEGAQVSLGALRSGAGLDGSPIGRTVGAAVDLAAASVSLAVIIGDSPHQALAQMHTLAARDFVSESELGRPRISMECEDPLRLGSLPTVDQIASRMDDLGQLLRESKAPGLLVAAVAHAEIAWMRPFGWGSGLISRALTRIVLAQRGVDPSMLTVPEVGLVAVGRPKYVSALRGYASGDVSGLSEWVGRFCDAVVLGAAAVAPDSVPEG